MFNFRDCNFRDRNFRVCRWLLLLACSHLCAATTDHPAGYYGYGKPATAAEIAGWDIDIRPDGTGLPDGSGSVEVGEQLYEAQCALCHGSFGEGVDRFPILAGGEGSLRDPRPIKSVGSYWAYTSTLWDYIRRTMPFTSPESLNNNEVYALTAYVLYLNDLVQDDFVLGKTNFTTVVLPNRHGFFADPRPDVHNIRCMENCKVAEEIKIVSSVSPSADSGQEEPPKIKERKTQSDDFVYNQYCSVCHKTGLAGAPIFGDSRQWETRAASGLRMLQRHAKDGFTGKTGVMPPRGGFMSLSDEEVDQAVKFMVESSQ